MLKRRNDMKRNKLSVLGCLSTLAMTVTVIAILLTGCSGPDDTTKSEVVSVKVVQSDNKAISSKGLDAARGDTINLKVDVEVKGDADKSVTWSVTGKASSDTKISTSGRLTIGADETATKLTIKATSKANTTKSHQITVNIAAPTDFAITYNRPFERGDVTGPTSAEQETTVTLTIRPNNGSRLLSLTVKKPNGAPITVIPGSNNDERTFTMPDAAVAIDAVFELIPAGPVDPNSPYFSNDFDTSLCSFFDKFDGNSLDTTKWAYQNGTGSLYGVAGWGNQERQSYHESAVTVADGKLSITVTRTSRDGVPYTSGKIVTANALPAHDPANPSNSTNRNDPRTDKFSQAYGRFEAKIRMSKAEQGMWPAFWMMPVAETYGGWPRSGEIDIMEMVGSKPTHASSTIHVMPNWQANSFWGSSEYTFENSSTFTDWHIYGIEWREGIMEYLIDGKRHGIVKNNPWNTQWYKNAGHSADAPFDKPFFLILNLAVGGWFDGGKLPDPNALPISLEVDWVRVYTLENNPWEIQGNISTKSPSSIKWQ